MPIASCPVIVPLWEGSSCIFSMSSDQVTVDRNKAFPDPSLLEMEQLQISQYLSVFHILLPLISLMAEIQSTSITPVTSSSAQFISRPTFSQIFFLILEYLEKTILVTLCLPSSFNPIEALAFLAHFYTHGNVFSSLPDTPFLLPPSACILFCIWAQSGPLCPSTLAFGQLAWLSTHWCGSFLCSEEALFEDQPALTGFFLPGQFPTGPYKKIPEQTNACSFAAQGLVHSSQDTKVHESHCHLQQSSTSSSSTYPHLQPTASSVTLQQGTVFNTFQKPHELVVPSHIALPTDIWMVLVTDDRVCDWHSLQLLKDVFAWLLFVTKWPAADTHYSITCTVCSLILTHKLSTG